MPEDVPSLQRSSSFYYTEERTVAMETFKSILMHKIAQLPSDDFMRCHYYIFTHNGFSAIILGTGMVGKIIFWLTMALISCLWYICILEII